VYPVGLRDWQAYALERREFGTQRVGRGEHHIVVPVPSTYAVADRFGVTPATYRPVLPGFPREPCVLRPVATASPPPSRIYCTYLARPDPLDPPPPHRWEPRPLDPHYLVVIARDSAFDLRRVRDQIEQIDIAAVSGEVGAQVMAQRLAGEGQKWAAWIVRP
jgi:hypothetical protein